MAAEMASPLLEIASALDPVVFAERCGVAPDAWQARFLRSTAAQRILLCSRQAGKTTVSALLALHEALYEPDSLILILAPSLRQSREAFRRVVDLYAAAGQPVAAETENKLELELTNGSRIAALPGSESTVRGFSAVTTLIVDEASRVPDELYQAVRPMLAVSRGRIVLLSTPAGKRGFFHAVWTEGGEAWERTKVTAYDVPRIDPGWLEEERRQLPRAVFEQEYLVEFAENDDAVFSHADIVAMRDDTIPPLFADEEMEGYDDAFD